MQLLFSLLVFVAFGIVVLYWTVALLARRGKCLQLSDDLGRVGLAIAFLVSTTSMLGSLYFSEIANYEPCRLCWYQRIFMYPISIVLLVALIRRRRDVVPYVLTLALLGSVISVYHYLVEWYPTLESNVCSLDVPCTTVWFREFGFISLPQMALTGFVTVFTVLVAPQITRVKNQAVSE
jgi:disulfide bond formation protein DsbB